MPSPAKTAAISLLALQSVASNSVLTSAVQDVSTVFQATVFIHFGRRSVTALTEGAKLRIEGSSRASLDGHWYPLAEFQTQIATAESELVTGTVAAGATAITMASTTNLTVADIIYVDNTTIANSEWARIRSVSANVSVTVEDALLNAQTGSTVYDQAEMFVATVDLGSVTRLRLVVDADNTGQAVAVEATMVTLTSIA